MFFTAVESDQTTSLHSEEDCQDAHLSGVCKLCTFEQLNDKCTVVCFRSGNFCD